MGRWVGGRCHTGSNETIPRRQIWLPQTRFGSRDYPDMKSFCLQCHELPLWPLILKIVFTPSGPLNLVMVIAMGTDLEQTTSLACARLGAILTTLLPSQRFINIYRKASCSSGHSWSYCTPLSTGRSSTCYSDGQGQRDGSCPLWPMRTGSPQWHATAWLCFVKVAACRR